MKIALNLFLFLIPLILIGEKSFALTDYKIKQICTKEKRKSVCVKNLKEKRSKLQEGDLIEIPVIPYRR